MVLEKIRRDVLSGRNIEEVLEKFDWKNFEQIVAEIFKSNDFIVYPNLRFKTKKRYEIDLIAKRRNIVLCIDCKEWSRGRHKKTGLRYAIKKQKERVKELVKFLKGNPIAENKLKMNVKDKFYPLIVTLFLEELVKENGSFIVPVWKLNSFLLEIESYLSLI